MKCDWEEGEGKGKERVQGDPLFITWDCQAHRNSLQAAAAWAATRYRCALHSILLLLSTIKLFILLLQ